MGRTYFPTRNDNGVRDLSTAVTLGGYLYTDYRGPAEPAAKAAMTPVNLGAMSIVDSQVLLSPRYRTPIYLGPPERANPPIPIPPMVLPINPAPPVSSQSTPTPQVTVPQLPPPTVIYITSGGGTASPAPAASTSVTPSPTTSTVNVAGPASVTDQVAAWLSGTTPIFSYNVPNALLAGGVILGFALLMGGGGKKR